MTAVLPGVHQIRLPMAGSRLRYVNSYLLEGDDGYLLIDCGWDTPDVLAALESGLGEVGVRVGDVRRLVVTHFHSDHYGLAGTLVRLAQLRLLMHRLDWLHVRTHMVDFAAMAHNSSAWFQRHGMAPLSPSEEERRVIESVRRYTVTPPDVELEDEYAIPVAGEALQVMWTPGHTEGHVCLYAPRWRVLFSGDHVLTPITPNISFSRPSLDNPLGHYLASLRKVRDLDVEQVLPAHGEPFPGLAQRVDELIEHHAERMEEALEQLVARPATAAEVAGGLPWTRRKTPFSELGTFERRMALSETISHLEEARAQGHVVANHENGRIYYRLSRDA